MEFRTPVEIEPSSRKLSHSGPSPLFLGSCFSDNIASRLRRDGFSVVSNPGGALYNPASISAIVLRALSGKDFKESELVPGPRGSHLLALATPFSGENPGKIIADANSVLDSVRTCLQPGALCFLTLGTAFVFEWKATGTVVGNCHKLPAPLFSRRRLGVDECVELLSPVIDALENLGVSAVLTVSPVRHTADTLHGNSLSKATLHLAVDALCQRFPASVAYFPAYEAIIDDLRDYRFTAPDMKHPTDQAADYVYELFSKSFFSHETLLNAAECRRESARLAHRQIL